MLRFISLSAMGGIFLMISPKLRLSLAASMDSGISGMEANSPWSYIGFAVLVIGCFLFSLSRGAQAS